MKTSAIRVKEDDDGSWVIFIDESVRGRYDNAEDMAMMLGLALVEIEDQQRLIDQHAVVHRINGSQDEYHKLVENLGSHEAAEKHIASRLRELADIVESPDYPKVFGWTDGGRPSPMASFVLTLSYPWGG